MTRLISAFENDPKLSGLVSGYVSRLPARIAELKAAGAADDWAELQRLAHQLKGSGGGYGFQPITEAGGMVEAALKRGEHAEARAHLATLIELCERACEPEGARE
jgi:HPt (histidine-containing phosphotransfer) domain-containing protein